MTYIFFWILWAVLAALAAAHRGRRVWVWIIVSIFIGPFAAILAWFLPKPSDTSKNPSN